MGGCINFYVLPKLCFVGGGTKILKFNIYTKSGRQVDVSSCTGTFTISGLLYDNVILSKPLISETAGNYMYVELTPIETKGLYGKYIYQLTIKQGNKVEEPKQGEMYVGKNIEE